MACCRYDLWMANLGPSETLLKAFLDENVTWGEFSRRYRTELFANGGVDDGNRTIKNHGQKFTLRLVKELSRRDTVTLLCHCDEDEQHCHRHLLQKMSSPYGCLRRRAVRSCRIPIADA